MYASGHTNDTTAGPAGPNPGPAGVSQGPGRAPTVACPSCGAPNPADAPTCRYCDTAMPAATPPPAAPGVPGPGIYAPAAWSSPGYSVGAFNPVNSSAGTRRGWRSFWIWMVVLTIVLPLVITVVVLVGVFRSVDSATSSFGSGFGGFGGNRSSTTKPAGAEGTPAGSVSFTSGLDGTIEATTVRTLGAANGSCATRASRLTGIELVGLTKTATAQRTVTVQVQLPEGATGPGTYENATAIVALADVPLPGASGAPTLGRWTGAATATVGADAAVTVTLTGLAPQGGVTEPLSGTVTTTCS